MRLSPLPLTAALLLTSTPLFAHSQAHHSHSDHSHSAHEHASLDSHVHGLAQMDLVLHDQQLLISLLAPAADIVGFEHAAQQDEDQARVHQAVAMLENPESLWNWPNAAACELKQVSVEQSLLGSKSASKPEHDHKHDHKHDHNHDHDHDHDHGQHSDFAVEYAFQCQAPEQLGAVEVKLFELFPSLTEIEVQLINSQGQNAMTLTPTHNTLKLIP